MDRHRAARRTARRAQSGDPLVGARSILRAVGSGVLAPEIVAFAALLLADKPTSADERAIASAAEALPNALKWTAADDEECLYRGYVLEFYKMIPKEPGQSTTFTRIQVEHAQDADEGLTPAADRLRIEFERESRGGATFDTPGWWAIRTGALAEDPHSLKALARIREEAPPEYEAVLQGWSRQIDREPRDPARLPARWRDVEADLHRRLMRAIQRASWS